MTNWTTGRRILVGTLVSGTLDILAAIGLTLWFGRLVPNMLRYVASGPFPGAKEMETPAPSSASPSTTR